MHTPAINPVRIESFCVHSCTIFCEFQKQMIIGLMVMTTGQLPFGNFLCIHFPIINQNPFFSSHFPLVVVTSLSQLVDTVESYSAVEEKSELVIGD
mmetsp:Transcript_30295/g.41685  ORF Transcript_30295/g.41685 Transcript_30295/m.41685 type:complete len:96 (+) Transcript_30295:255-542(+)